MLRISRKLATRWPLTRIAGNPLPRPRPELVCGLSSAIRLAIEAAPYEAISSSLSVRIGGCGASTWPISRAPMTRISPLIGLVSSSGSTSSGSSRTPGVAARAACPAPDAAIAGAGRAATANSGAVNAVPASNDHNRGGIRTGAIGRIGERKTKPLVWRALSPALQLALRSLVDKPLPGNKLSPRRYF